MSLIAANLDRVRQQIAEACDRAHRPASDVALMAVSKMHPAEAILEAHAAGQGLFGENRVQEWQEKSPKLQNILSLQNDDRPEVHLIGPVQANKTSRAAELFHAIDTVDSLRTAGRLNATAQSLGKTLPVLIEVKLSHEESKHGIAPGELSALLAQLDGLDSLTVRGLMSVPPWSEDPETARPYFRELRRLRDENRALCPTLVELSIGMSNDFIVAIEEGSTCVRIGTAIFGRRIYPTASNS